MYESIIENIEHQIDEKELVLIKSSTLHLGVFNEPCLTYMLDGKKTIESRFSKKRIAPYNNITKDDIVFVKKSGGKIVAYFKIKEVRFYDLESFPASNIRHEFNKYLCVDDEFWQKKKDSKYATLIFIKELVRLKPFSVQKKGMNTWIKIKRD